MWQSVKLFNEIFYEQVDEIPQYGIVKHVEGKITSNPESILPV